MNGITGIPAVLSARPVADPVAEVGKLPLLQAGQNVAARVISVDTEGALLSLAGHTVRVEVDQMPRLAAGQALSLRVLSATPQSLVLRRLDADTTASPTDLGTQPTLVRRDLAAALGALGVVVDDDNLLGAQALVRFGVALTSENLGDLRRTRAVHTLRLPETAALAKSLGLPLSPAILRALETLLVAPDDKALMSITIPVRSPAAAIAPQIEMAARAVAQSVENKLLTGDIDGARSDLRAHLLGRAHAGDGNAERAALYLEGQMLVNAASVPADPQRPFYVAFVAAAAQQIHHVEMRFEADPAEDDPGTNANGAPSARATVRIPTAHLGVVTARLQLTAPGCLACDLLATSAPATQRIGQSMEQLTAALAKAGFAHATARAEHRALPDLTATPQAAASQPLLALDVTA